ncbi:GNAT family N-acetyltransferase [Lentibacillus sp. N15]|uniref:GNAT family N-acetyltransferase n=1 Tax=Lentibacillus songyuanensis TaxID=3136161 RepID=UPI0031B9F97C
MNYMIRTMTVDDISQVQHVAKTSWNSTYDGLIPKAVQDDFLKRAYSDERMKQRLENSLLLVAEAGGEIVGFANFSPVNKDGIAELGAIYLLPAYQGNGIGTALLDKGLEQQPRTKELFISVEKDNKIGKQFYDAKGFKVISEFEENVAGHVLQTVRMVLRI